MFLSARIRHSTFICALALVACSEQAPLPPHCRTATELPVQTTYAAGCIITSNDKLLVIQHRLSGKLDIPAGGSDGQESAACTAHRETFEETGMNTFINAALGSTESGMGLYSCVQQSGFDADRYPQLEVPNWSSTEVTAIFWVDPFELTHKDWRYPDQLSQIRDAFVAARQHQE